MDKLKVTRILFYVPGMDVINDGVYYSQVFALARYAVSLGAKCLIVYTSSREPNAAEFLRDGVDVIRCTWDNRYTPLPLMPWKFRRMTKPAEARMAAFEPTHVYVRDPLSGYAGISLTRKLEAKLVFSRRGAGIVSEVLTLKTFVQEAISRYYVWRILRYSDHVNTVSEVLKKYESRWYHGPMSVLPCCVMPERLEVVSDDERVTCRQELGIPLDAKVIVYSGGLSSYQCIDEILDLMKRMHDVDNRLVFMILTKSQDVLLEKIKAIGLPANSVRTKSCAPVEVSRYLQSADVAVILRKDNLLNRTASPVKIGEYLASGLGVIVSPCIGDVATMFDGKDFALLAEPDMMAGKAVAFTYAMDDVRRGRARDFAAHYYTYEGNVDIVQAMFAL